MEKVKDILHRIKVYLYQNYLTDNPNDYSAKVSSERTLSTKELCVSAVGRGGAPSTAEAMEHNVQLFLKEMAYQLMDGFSVNTGYFTAGVQIRGVFSNIKETYNKDKHSILFRFNQGELLRKEIPNIEVEIMGVGNTDIIISHVVDKKSGTVNDIITPGGTLKIKGGRLKIVGDDPSVGVYFENSLGGTVKVDFNDIIVNNPSELIVEIPDYLRAGLTYTLIIKNQFAAGTILKEPRTVVFDKILKVI